MNYKKKISILTLILILLGTACAPVASAVPTVQATEASSAYPVTIAHKYGETTITKFPERIVLVGLTDQDALLALGIIPVATREWWGERPGAIFEWAKDKLGDAPLPVVLGGGELNFEQIASLKPDVIVGLYGGLTKEEYTTLSKIAPTVAQPGEHPDWGIPWPEMTRKIGLIVGKSAQAETLISNLEARFDTIRKEHPEFANSIGVVAADGQTDYWAYSSKDPRGQFLTSLGFKPSTALDKMIGSEFGAPVSRERLDLLNDVGVLIWFADTAEKVKSDTLYQQLDVIKQGRDIVIPWDAPMAYAYSFNTVLSLPYVLDNLVPQIVTAADGDPSTNLGSAPGAGVEPTAAAAFPVTIQHRLGTITIPSEPKRVVALSNADADVAILSGIIPIAMSKDAYAESDGIASWLKKDVNAATIKLLETETEIPFEAIAALKPDLILASGHYAIDEAVYAKLSQIAPTMIDLKGWGVESWRDQTIHVSQALGQVEKARAAVAETDAAIKKFKADYPKLAGKTFSLSFFYAENSIASVRAPEDYAVQFLQELGMVLLPALVKEETAVTDNISFERLDLIDAEVMILGFMTPELGKVFDSNPVAQNLKAVKNKGYVSVGLETLASMRNPSVLAVRWVLDQLRPRFDTITIQ